MGEIAEDMMGIRYWKPESQVIGERQIDSMQNVHEMETEERK